MRRLTNTRSSARSQGDSEPQLGLFRRETLGSEPAGTVGNLFADLRRVSRGEIIAEHPGRNLQGRRLVIDRAEGHGSWEMYRLDQEVYLFAADGVYDGPRIETVPGEGMVEFHLRLAGVLEMAVPGCSETVTVRGPRLLMLYQPPGVAVTERIAPKIRDTGVSLYCRPKFLAELARQNGIERWPILEEIQKQSSATVWLRQAELSPTLLYVGKSLLDSPYTRGIRLLHAEAKALELLCDVLAQGQEPESDSFIFTDLESRQLLHARRLLSTQLSEPLRVADIARAIGMSESKLKRTFKARFGITVFDFGLSCRMRHALQLLRCGRLSVGEVAYAAGYRHPTSFSAAFLDFFGFLPRKARTEMH